LLTGGGRRPGRWAGLLVVFGWAAPGEEMGQKRPKTRKGFFPRPFSDFSFKLFCKVENYLMIQTSEDI
jgi:hypothetical protein